MRLKPARPSAALGANRKARILAEIAEMIDDVDFSEALSRLQEYIQVYPDDMAAHMLRASVYQGMEAFDLLEDEAQWLVNRSPNRPECHEIWVLSATGSERFTVASLRVDHCLEKWPKSKFFVDLADVLHTHEEVTQGEIAEFCSVPPDWRTLVAANEEAEFLITYNRFDEAMAICEKSLTTSPDFVPLRNSRAICRFEVGELEEARAELDELLKVSGTPAVALNTLASIALLQGHHQEAAALAMRMRAECDHGWCETVAGALSLTGEFEALCQYYEEIEPTADIEPIVKHYAATAYARTGDTVRAKSLWQQALRDDPDLVQATLNLADLAEPVGERNGPWSHTLSNYMPIAMANDLQFTFENSGDASAWDIFLTEWPEFMSLASVMLERGHSKSREVVLLVLLLHDVHKHRLLLLDFASGSAGPDVLRESVYQFLSWAGALPRGRFPLWQSGVEHEVSSSVLHSMLGAAGIATTKGDRLALDAYIALEEGRLSDALTGFTAALKSDPDSSNLLNNLAITYKAMGNEQKYKEMVSTLYQKHPEYLFANTNMAEIAMDSGDLRVARELLMPLTERMDLRISEHETLYGALIRLAALEANQDEASRWLNMLESAAPGSDFISICKQQIAGIDLLTRRVRGATKRKKQGDGTQTRLF